MRLDKFLQVSRLIKRRTLAKRACTQGRVQLNERVAKAGAEVKIGDRLQVDFGRRSLQVEVLALAEKSGVRDAASLYRILDEKLEGEKRC
ncbi:MAG: RNA-binding S4 domain-containing protein [Firmicutes bacterium]|nr:RNA-binding S4 domain-containing protein [Bacillota bacterium]